MKALEGLLTVTLFSLFAANPAGGTYQLKGYEFGTGGGDASSGQYRLNVSTDQLGGDPNASSTYKLGSGLPGTVNSNVPLAPSFTNPSSYYDRLRLILNTSSNPSDTTFVIAISTDNFATTNYVQSDNTVGPTLGAEDRQTYTAWGGASGILVLGLSSNTTYQVKVKAFQGRFTETGYGPITSASTVNPSLTFSITTTLTAVPPFSTGFTSLPAGSVVNGDADVNLGLTTNALNGGDIYIYNQNSGLLSASAGFTIASATANLASAQTGYGAQVIATSQVAGGPITALSPFNGVSDNVGVINTSVIPILRTSSAVTTATATVRFKAKSSSTTPASSDYTDRLTFVAGMQF